MLTPCTVTALCTSCCEYEGVPCSGSLQEAPCRTHASLTPLCASSFG